VDGSYKTGGGEQNLKFKNPKDPLKGDVKERGEGRQSYNSDKTCLGRSGGDTGTARGKKGGRSKEERQKGEKKGKSSKANQP